MNLKEIEKGVIDVCIEVGQFIRHEGANFDHARIEQKVKSLNVTIRKALGLFANVRPTRSYAPYIRSRHENVDLVIVPFFVFA